MCPPLLIAAATIGSTAMSAFGAIQQGNAAKAQADAQANNDDRQAVMTLQQGQYQAGRKQDEINQTEGKQVALTSGSGVDLSGSPSDVISSTASEGALDTSAIRYGAQVNASNLQYAGANARIAGQNAQTGGYLGAVGVGIGGIGALGNQYARLGRPYGGGYGGGLNYGYGQ